MTEIAATPNLIGLGVENLNLDGQASDVQINEYAEEFEGVFLSLLVKEMRNTVEGGGLFGSENSDSFGSLFDLYMGQHLAAAQPLGIASLWIEQYEQNSIENPNDDSTQSTTG